MPKKPEEKPEDLVLETGKLHFGNTVGTPNKGQLICSNNEGKFVRTNKRKFPY